MISLKEIASTLPADYRERAERGRMDFILEALSWTPLAASSAGTAQTLNVDSEGDYLILGADRVVTDATYIAKPTVAPITLEAKLGAGGREFAPSGTHLDNFAGTAERPMVFPVPLIVPAGNKLVVTLANLTATAYYVRLGLVCVKLYR